jgi:hypothetical protein
VPAAATRPGTLSETKSHLVQGAFLKDETKASFAIIRHNIRTYESGGVMMVVKGRTQAEGTLIKFETGQGSEDRHAGWRYFIEKTDLKVGMDPAIATKLRQTRLEMRESQEIGLDTDIPFSRQN